MTREEILAMTAGRELDASVAERVMGWDTSPAGNYFKTGADRLVRSERHQFSTDISAAWEVVEKLGRYFTVGRNKDGYTAHVITNKREEAITCKTAPEAICKAALLAVMDV